jgi:hypothetical protein
MMSMLSTVKGALRPVYYDMGAARLVQRWRRRPAAFERERVAYMRNHVTVTNAAPTDPHLAALVSDGFVLIPALHDRVLIQQLHDRIYDIADRVRSGRHDKDWNTLTYQEDGIYRIREIEKVVPDARQILDHPMTNALVRSYLQTTNFRTTGNYVDFKPDLVHDYTTVPHLDSWKSQLKIFTLLADVGEPNAPLVYFAKTHRDGSWRHHFDYTMWAGDYIGGGGVVPPHVLRDLHQSGDSNAPSEVMITAPAGSAIIADTRGVHRASNLRAGYRLQIVQKFTVE